MLSLANCCILVGVTGGIAAYKAAELVSRLKKAGAEVKVIMTRAATQFITSLTLQSLSGNPVAVEMFEAPARWDIHHISLAQEASAVIIAPCTANVIGKLAGGIADDMLTTTVLATRAPILLAPAMNNHMYENPIVQENLQRLARRGYTILEPDSGPLACGDSGKGRMPAPELLAQQVLAAALRPRGDLQGRRFLVTAGATQEALDPVRFLTNHSSGKMGYAIANAAYLRGAEVTLVAAPGTQRAIPGVQVVPVVSAQDMYQAVLSHAPDAHVIIKAAAVADFRPETKAENKLKKAGRETLSLNLAANPDILQTLGERYGGQKLLVGFCMETQELLAHAREKLAQKHLDYIVANDLNTPGAGFGGDTNRVTVLGADGTEITLPLMQKEQVAQELLDLLAKKL